MHVTTDLAGAVTKAEHAVLGRVERDTDELVELAVDLARAPSPHGHERRVAGEVLRWLDREELDGWLQPITAGSCNVVARLRGRGTGRSLMLNAHLDTGPPSTADPAPAADPAWHDDGTLYGGGLVNDKAQLAAIMVAFRAVARCGATLAGDLWLTGTAFETGRPSLPGRSGIDRPGEGFGAFWLVNRGVLADYALVAETSGFGVVEVEAGAATITVTLRGRHTYTPRLERDPATGRARDSALLAIGETVDVVEAWAAGYEQRARAVIDGHEVAPRAQVVGVEGGPAVVTIELDVRLAPGADPRPVVDDVERTLAAEGIVAGVQLVQWSRGHLARGSGDLRDALVASHRCVHGVDPPRPPVAETSMWRDMNAFNEVGMPALCYGPPRRSDPFSEAGDRALDVRDLVAATKAYALTALRIVGADDA
jgi:acetylornithine deacetylase/succinyl-diaminopimelate desuccinylase-like protein